MKWIGATAVVYGFLALGCVTPCGDSECGSGPSSIELSLVHRPVEVDTDQLELTLRDPTTDEEATDHIDLALADTGMDTGALEAVSLWVPGDSCPHEVELTFQLLDHEGNPVGDAFRVRVVAEFSGSETWEPWEGWQIDGEWFGWVC